MRLNAEARAERAAILEARPFVVDPTEYVKLAYFIAHRLYRSMTVGRLPYEDVVSDCMFALVKAAKTFDPAYRVRFPTYASKCMTNEVRMTLRRTGKFAEIPTDFSLVLKEGDDPIETRLLQDDRVDVEGAAIAKVDGLSDLNVIIATVWPRLAPVDRQIVPLMVQGHLQRAIGRRLGISQSYVSRRRKVIRRVIEKEARRHGLIR